MGARESEAGVLRAKTQDDGGGERGGCADAAEVGPNLRKGGRARAIEQVKRKTMSKRERASERVPEVMIQLSE